MVEALDGSVDRVLAAIVPRMRRERNLGIRELKAGVVEGADPADDRLVEAESVLIKPLLFSCPSAGSNGPFSVEIHELVELLQGRLGDPEQLLEGVGNLWGESLSRILDPTKMHIKGVAPQHIVHEFFRHGGLVLRE